MLIISYRPGDDQFWIGCTMAEAGAELRTAYSVVDEIPAFKAFYEKYYG